MRHGKVNQAAVDELLRNPALARRLEDIGEEWVRRARALAPVGETGNLRDHIEAELVVENGRVAVRVGWTDQASYGMDVELGTEDTAAQPHIRPAGDSLRRS